MAEDIVGSKMPTFASDALKPSKAGYGQNGYQGASSDLPGENTTAGFLPGISQADLTAALDRVSPKDSRDTVRDASGKGNPPAPKDFKQPKFDAPQTREVSADSYPLAMGMNARSNRNA
jgi:hypothetical protein